MPRLQPARTRRPEAGFGLRSSLPIAVTLRLHRLFIGSWTLLVLMAVQATLLAQTTWTNSGTNDWNTATNWNSGVPTSSSGAVFPSAGAVKNPDVSGGPFAVKGITIDNTGAAYSITGTGSLDLGADGISITGGGTTTISPSIQAVASQNWTIGSNTTANVNGAFGVASPSTVTANGTGTLNLVGSVSFSNSSSAFTNTSGVARFSGSLTSSGQGSINIDGGSVFINNDYRNILAVNLNSGGTLGGTGRVQTISSQSGSTIAPGDIADVLGTLAIGSASSDNTTLAGSTGTNGSRLLINIDGTGNDDKAATLSIRGTLTLGDGGNGTTGNNPYLDINLFTGTPTIGNEYTIVTHSSTRTGFFNDAAGNLLLDNAIFTDGATWRINYLAGSIILTAVPEPASLAMLGLVTLSAAGYGWRRRKQAA